MAGTWLKKGVGYGRLVYHFSFMSCSYKQLADPFVNLFISGPLGEAVRLLGFLMRFSH